MPRGSRNPKSMPKEVFPASGSALPWQAKPKAPMPFRQYTSFRLWPLLDHLGFLNEAGDGYDPGVVALLHQFRRLFIGPHAGVYRRRLNGISRVVLRKNENYRIDDATQHRLFYRPESKAETPGITYTTARPARLRSSVAYAIEAAAKKKLGKGGLLSPHERDVIDQEHQRHLHWEDLFRHFSHGFNPLFHEFYQLDVAADSPFPYVVLDLDDHASPETLVPKPPSPHLAGLLASLAQVPLLNPANALVVTSPSGTGLHVYYRLRRAELAQSLSWNMSWFLRAQGIQHVDVYPKFPSESTRRCAMTTLPLTRGSHLCDAHGVPLPALPSFRATFQRFVEAAANTPRLDFAAVTAAMKIAESSGDTKSSKHGPAPSIQPKNAKAKHAPGSPVPVPLPATSELWKGGLTAFGQRCAAIADLAEDCWRMNRPYAQAYASLVEWLNGKHNGLSHDYNADPERAREYIKVALSRWYEKGARAPRTLTKADAAALIEKIAAEKTMAEAAPAVLDDQYKKRLRGRVALGNARLSGVERFRKLLMFAGDLFAYARQIPVVAAGEEGSQRPVHRVVRISKTQFQSCEGGSDENYLDQLELLEWLHLGSRGGDASRLRKQAQVFRVLTPLSTWSADPKQQAGELPVHDALVAALTDVPALRLHFFAGEQEWKAFKDRKHRSELRKKRLERQRFAADRQAKERG